MLHTQSTVVFDITPDLQAAYAFDGAV